MAMEILPSIDLRAGRVVRLRQGDYALQQTYDVDPLAVAASYAAAGARWIHVVDLDGAQAGRPIQLDLIRRVIAAATAGQSSGQLANATVRVQVGGGVRTRQDVMNLLDAGAARVVVGTKAIEDWPFFQSLARDPTLAGRLVLALDAKDGRVAVRAWTQTTELTAIDIAQRANDLPLAGLLYTDVATDGMLTGPNLVATAALAESTRLPVIASGGVGSIDHVRALAQLPIWGAIVGRSLYEGRLNLAEALAVGRAGMGADPKPGRP
jgi:phosphoribosylformimino-5-aminoimidazole carboxamide ribotide isomerase